MILLSYKLYINCSLLSHLIVVSCECSFFANKQGFFFRLQQIYHLINMHATPNSFMLNLFLNKVFTGCMELFVLAPIRKLLM